METQDILLTIFTGILAVAVFMQTLIFFGILRAIRRLSDKVDGLSKDLLKNVEIVTAKTNETLTTIRNIGNGLLPVKDRLVDAAEILHKRVVTIDDFLEETTNTVRSQVLRMKTRLESATDRAEQLLEEIRNSVMIPVNEIHAITRGIRAGYNLLFRRRRNTSDTSHQDEEMFI